jgi:hypothetical protein
MKYRFPVIHLFAKEFWADGFDDLFWYVRTLGFFAEIAIDSNNKSLSVT